MQSFITSNFFSKFYKHDGYEWNYFGLNIRQGRQILSTEVLWNMNGWLEGKLCIELFQIACLVFDRFLWMYAHQSREGFLYTLFTSCIITVSLLRVPLFMCLRALFTESVTFISVTATHLINYFFIYIASPVNHSIYYIINSPTLVNWSGDHCY